jgi:hypothetical protein
MANLTREEWVKIKDIKQLDLEICSFCSKLNILNLVVNEKSILWKTTQQKEKKNSLFRLMNDIWENSVNHM